MATYTGGEFNNFFGGAPDNDSASGAGGADTLNGAAGTDTLDGGADNDLLIQDGAPTGAEVFNGGAGIDTLRVNGSGNLGFFNTTLNSIERLEFGSSVDSSLTVQLGLWQVGAGLSPAAELVGGAGVDMLVLLTPSNVSPDGTNQYIVPSFSLSNWTTSTNGPSDLIILVGTNGSLNYTLRAAEAHEGIQILIGAAGNDRLLGGDDREFINGNLGADTLEGGWGDDTLSGDGTNGGAAGADHFVIGGGQDVINDFVHGTDKFDISEYGFDSFASLQPFLSASGGDTVLSFIFNGVVNTTTFKGVAFGTLDAGDFIVAGNNPVNHTGEDAGTPNADFLPGSNVNDSIDGAGGDDTLNGFGGNDSLVGGDGADNINGGGGADTLTGDAGNDTLIGGGPDLINGGVGADSLVVVGAGGSGATLNGGADNDTFVALNLLSGVPVGNFAGTNFNGGAGHDTLVVGGAVNFQGSLNSIEGVHLLAADPAANRGATVLDIGSTFDLNADFEGGPETISVSGTGLIRFTSTDAAGDDFDASAVTFFAGSNVTFEVHGAGGADSLVGSSNGDSMVGEGGNDTVIGGGGNDSLAGLAGSDSLSGGDGSDNLNGGSEADMLSGGLGADTLDGGLGADTLQGGDGADSLTLLGGQGPDSASGDAGDDFFGALNFTVRNTATQAVVATFQGDFAGSTFNGGAGHDTLGVSGYSHFLGTLNGIEKIFLRPAGDVVNGPNTIHFNPAVLEIGSGFELNPDPGEGVTVSGAGRIIYHIAQEDLEFDGSQLIFRAGADVTFEVHGSDGGDTIIGTSAEDDLRGGDGNDKIVAGADDGVSLGAGSDTLVIDAGMTIGALSMTVTDFEAGSGGDAISITAFLAAKTNWVAGTDPFASGHLALIQSGEDALLQVDANGGGDNLTTILEFEGVNALALTAANLGGWGPTIKGGSGGDALDFTPEAPVQPGDEAPALDGGAGVDTLTLSTESLDPASIVGPASITPSADGTALLFDLNGDGTTDLVVTNVEDIVLNGQQVVISGNLAGTGLAPNTIHYEGTDDNDVFDAGGLTSLESIRAKGYAGNDKIIGANDDDTLEGGDGNDSLTGRGGPDSLNGGAGLDELRGGDDADTLDGGADADKLFGDSGDDRLIGGLGADQLDGGNGKDSLSGGDGADVLFGGNGQDTLSGGAGGDFFRIEKGTADQILDFSHADGDKLVFVGGSGSVSLKIVDADGDGQKDDLSVSASGGFSVELIGVTTLQGSDWVFG